MESRTITISKRDATIVTGASCFLASLLCSLTGQISHFSGLRFTHPLDFLLCGLAVVLLMLCSKLFRKRTCRIVLSTANIALFVIWVVASAILIISPALDAPTSNALTIAYGTIGRICLIILTVQWNYHISNLPELNGLRLAIVIGALTALLYLALSAIGGTVALIATFFACGYSAVVCALLDQKDAQKESIRSDVPSADSILLEDSSEEDPQEPLMVEGQKRHRMSITSFFASRVAFGTAFGVLLGISTGMSSIRLSSPWLTATTMILLIAAIVFLVLSDEPQPGTHDIAGLAPACLYLLLLGCFGMADPSGTGRILPGIAILPWFLQMYVQLPSYRKMLGIDPAQFAYLERLSALLPFEILTATLSWASPKTSDTIHVLAPMSGWLATALVIVCTIVMIRHFHLYYPETRGETHQSDEVGFEAAIARLCDQYGISPREQDVLRLLAEGYSRPFIEKRLYISAGTVKTHTYHIYRKMGLSSRDELISLLKETQGQDKPISQ